MSSDSEVKTIWRFINQIIIVVVIVVATTLRHCC